MIGAVLAMGGRVSDGPSRSSTRVPATTINATDAATAKPVVRPKRALAGVPSDDPPTASTIGAGYFCAVAMESEEPQTFFIPFLLTFIVLFATTGIGNGSTFRMIGVIFQKDQRGPVLGWTSAIAAYGAFFIPKIFGEQIKNGTPEYALYGFAGYYLSCLVVNWWFYARKNAEIPC